jgi:hypothetical protein
MTNDTNSGSKSADEVQREVRQSRAEVEDALEAIQDRLSPSQMFDQAVNYLRGSGGNEFMRNLGATVRDNPVPVALLGTGLAWLMLSRARPRRPYDEDEDRPDGYGADYYGAGDYPAGYPEGDNGFGDRPFGSEAAARAEPGLASDQGFVERAKETAAAAGATAQGWPKALRSWGAIGSREHANQRRSGALERERQPGESARRRAAPRREPGIMVGAYGGASSIPCTSSHWSSAQSVSRSAQRLALPCRRPRPKTSGWAIPAIG